MTDTTHDINEALKGNYVMFTLKQSRWSASKPDPELAREVAQAHGASPKAVGATKKIMAGADDELNAVNKALNSIRTYLYSVSVPWAGNTEGAKRGPRLVPATFALEAIKTLSALQSDFDQAMVAFKATYATRVQQALANSQGSLADPSLYPDPSEVDSMFSVSLDIEPVPTISDFSRMTIPASLAEALGNRMAKRQSKVIENAMQDLTGRIVKAVGNMAEQLHKHAGGHKTRLHATLVGNVRGLLDLLKTSNLTNDPELDELADMMSGIVTHDIKTLKANPGTAKSVADKAAAIVQHIKGPKTVPVTVQAVTAPVVAAAIARKQSALSSSVAASIEETEQTGTNYGDYLY